jgi:hypothetical protein
MHFPVNTRPFYLIVLLALTILGRSRLSPLLRGARDWVWSSEKPSPYGFWLSTLAVLVLSIHVVGAALPERYWDALVTHLMVPSYVAAYAQWSFDFGNFTFALMPMGADWLYSVGFLLGGEASAKLLNFALFTLALWMLFGILRRSRTLSSSLLGVMLLSSTPIAFIETASLFTENALLLFLFAAYVELAFACEDRHSHRFLLVTILLGAALSVKIHAMFIAVPLWAWLVVMTIRSYRRRVPLLALGAVLLVMLAALAPFIWSILQTGNPVFPFFNAVFRSPYYDASANWVDARWPGGFGISEIFGMTFRSSEYMEAQDGAFGFVLVGLAVPGIAAAVSRPNRPLIMALVSGAVCFIGISMNSQYLRYLYPAFPLLIMVCAASLDASPLPDAIWHRLTSFFAFCIILLNLVYAPASGWILPAFDINALLAEEQGWDLVRRDVPQRILVEIVNDMSGGHAGVAFFGPPYGAGLDGTPYYTGGYNLQFTGALYNAPSSSLVANAFRVRGIEYAIVEDRSLETLPAVTVFLRERADLILRLNHAALYRIRPDGGPGV